MFDLIVVGGGAAGFYGAIQTAIANPKLKIAILERGKSVLGKVKVSGGGRCNVTHSVFEPLPLSKSYPRGGKELLGPFHSYAPGDVVEFFEERGVPLKVESDGRMFPVTDSSQTIIDCFLETVRQYDITLLKNSSVKDIAPSKTIPEGWRVTTMNKHYHCKKLLVTTGSNPKMWQLLHGLGHKIIGPVPSLFTFNCNDGRIKGLQGLSTIAQVDILPKTHYDTKIVIQLKSMVRKEALFSEEGPVLITHWGFSGPAILKLSAWAAKELNEFHYHFKIRINWTTEYSHESMLGFLGEMKFAEAKKTVLKTKLFDLPNRLWVRLVKAANIDTSARWADLNKDQVRNLASQLTESTFSIKGKSTFKEEFVTAGGVDLKEINFKTFESKCLPNIYFAGEVLNIDAITGGYNFQNAWTGAHIAAQAIAKSLS